LDFQFLSAQEFNLFAGEKSCSNTLCEVLLSCRWWIQPIPSPPLDNLHSN
jgi:hypothetical protein